jgi:hypothetical protein
VLAYLLLRLLQVNRSKYSFGTKMAKFFHGTRYEGELLGYDAKEDYHWILYSDGDYEDLNYAEMYQAVQEHGQEARQWFGARYHLVPQPLYFDSYANVSWRCI